MALVTPPRDRGAAASSLHVEGVTLQFAGLRALDDVTSRFRPAGSPR